MRILILIISLLFLVSFKENNTQGVNVFDAIKNSQIRLIATSNGNHSGSSVIIKIEKLKNIESIIIPSGTRFISEFEDDQDLLIIDDEIIVLTPHTTQRVINGFCVQSSNKSPSNESRFTIAKERNEKLIKVAEHLNKKGFNDDIKQTALWCVSDNADVSGIHEEGNEQVEKLRNYICSLMGKKDVWYNTNPTYSIDENRNIIQKTTKVEGLLSYTVTKVGNMNMEICKENGEVIRAYGGENSISHLGEYNFNFSLEVSGWQSGKYSVQLKIGDDIIHKEDFVIS